MKILGIGPPYHVLNDSNKTLFETGITGPTRILVKCDKFTYQHDLLFQANKLY